MTDGKPVDVLSDKMLLAGFGYPREKDHKDAKILGELGELAEGEGVRVTLLPHYLLIEAAGNEESGELWLPVTTLLTLIGEMHEHTAN